MSWAVAFEMGRIDADVRGRGLPSLAKMKKRTAADPTKG